MHIYHKFFIFFKNTSIFDEIPSKWVLSAEYIEGKRLVFDITFVKEDVLERYQALHQSTKHILGETRYEYIDEYSEVCEMLDDIANLIQKVLQNILKTVLFFRTGTL